MSKTKTLVSSCWYAVRHRVIPFLGKNAFALLTVAFFIYLYGICGGVDIWRITDREAFIRILASFGVWLLSLAVVMIVKGFWASYTEKAAFGVTSTEGGKEK